MSFNTMKLKDIVESPNIDIGMVDYPLHNDTPERRDELNWKIFNKYYFRQIEYETPERFVFEINARMERIMPYYNQLLSSEELKFDPLISYVRKHIEDQSKNINTTDSQKEDTNGTRSDNVDLENSTTNNSKRDVNADQSTKEKSNTNTNENETKSNKEIGVQSTIPSEEVTIGDIDGNVYADTAETKQMDDTNNRNSLVNDSRDQDVNEKRVENINENSFNKQGQKTDSTVDSSLKRDRATLVNDIMKRNFDESGIDESYSKLLNEFRSTFLRIDEMIIEELEPCFLKVYGGDYRVIF